MKLKSSILIFVVMITMLLSRMSGQTTVSDTKSSAAKIVYVPFDFTDAAEKAKKSVVYIETKSGISTSNRKSQNA